VTAPDLALEAEDAQLLGRAGGRGEAEQVHCQPRVRCRLLACPVDDQLGPAAGDERRESDER
jgi:hypothetical protein